MSNLRNNLHSVVDGLSAEFEKYGFTENAEFYVENDSSIATVFEGEKGAIKLEYNGRIITMYQGETGDDATKKISSSLLDKEPDPRDMKYIIAEFTETLEKKFGTGKKAQKKGASQKNAQQTVSKNAVKQGSSYDANTLASRLCHVFPELRPLYQDNLAKYGEFLGEEFFTKYGTKVIIDTIKANNPQTMKKMFQVLNEIYEDGTNDTQSLIAVTIMGELNNDQILLARCVDYMSETMAPPVIEVNRYLASAMGKKAKEKLLNPPVYKPKKQKKPGFFAQAMAQGGGTPMPPM
ncbi:MAG: hypothetical protein IKY78_03535 [Clostridia bacterium]|nr:hypothetical protein [Clostridia bacterium]